MTDFNDSGDVFFSLEQIDDVKVLPTDLHNSVLSAGPQRKYPIRSSILVEYQPFPFLVNAGRSVWNMGGHTAGAISLAVLKDMIVREWDFYMMSQSSGRLFKNSIGSHVSVDDTDGKKTEAGFVAERINHVKTEKPAFIICNDGWRNYWHWHAQTMLAINFMADLGLLKDVSLVSGELKPWQAQCLEAVGVKLQDITIIPGGYHHFEEIIYPSFLDPRSFISIDPLFVEMLSRVKQRVAGGPASAADIRHPERLYVSRRDAPHRTMQNEAELIEMLQQFGFSEFVPSEHTYAAQVEAFSHAKVVVGIHGAGLTNIGFMPKTGLCIEIFDKNYMNYVYYVTSRLSGIKYECVLTSSGDGDAGWKPDLLAIVQAVLRFIQMHAED